MKESWLNKQVSRKTFVVGGAATTATLMLGFGAYQAYDGVQFGNEHNDVNPTVTEAQARIILADNRIFIAHRMGNDKPKIHQAAGLHSSIATDMDLYEDFALHGGRFGPVTLGRDPFFLQVIKDPPKAAHLMNIMEDVGIERVSIEIKTGKVSEANLPGLFEMLKEYPVQPWIHSSNWILLNKARELAKNLPIPGMRFFYQIYENPSDSERKIGFANFLEDLQNPHTTSMGIWGKYRYTIGLVDACRERHIPVIGDVKNAEEAAKLCEKGATGIITGINLLRNIVKYDDQAA